MRIPNFIVRLARFILIRSVVSQATAVGADPTTSLRVATREIDLILESVRVSDFWIKSEGDIIGDRLLRRYDVAMAMNEATNRAIVQRAAVRAEIAGNALNPQQAQAFEYQKAYLARIVKMS